jgi:hypothetical protein
MLLNHQQPTMKHQCPIQNPSPHPILNLSLNLSLIPILCLNPSQHLSSIPHHLLRLPQRPVAAY